MVSPKPAIRRRAQAGEVTKAECKYVDGSGGDVTKVRIQEEALHQVRQLSQPVQRGQRLSLEILGAADPRLGRAGRA